MHDKILELAASLAGAEDGEQPLLEELCRAAAAEWTARLPEGVPPESCGSAFVCAAAFSAAAGFAAGRENLASLSAGDVAVKIRSGTESAAALQDAAERLMAPFVPPKDLFLKGVPG